MEDLEEDDADDNCYEDLEFDEDVFSSKFEKHLYLYFSFLFVKRMK